MWNLLKRLANLFVPAHIQDPGLLFRMIGSKDKAAWFTLVITFLGVVCLPLDLLLYHLSEKKRYNRASRPNQPIIFICGTPRTGTTLMEQVLAKHLPVTYFNNLTAVFPRSPITANLLFQRFMRPKIEFKSYYSKTLGFSGPNDAFYLWNRWMTEDETGMQCVLIDSREDSMVKFFGAYQEAFHKPLLSKNNSLNTRAKRIADVFENAYFICMTRDPAYLAQALLQTRMEIQGDAHIQYGVDNPDKPEIAQTSFVASICDQVLYHEQKNHEQQQLIGSDRFWIVPYEEFCKSPAAYVAKVYQEMLNQPVDREALEKNLPPFVTSNQIRVAPELFEEIQQTLAHMRDRSKSS